MKRNDTNIFPMVKINNKITRNGILIRQFRKWPKVLKFLEIKYFGTQDLILVFKVIDFTELFQFEPR